MNDVDNLCLRNSADPADSTDTVGEAQYRYPTKLWKPEEMPINHPRLMLNPHPPIIGDSLYIIVYHNGRDWGLNVRV